MRSFIILTLLIICAACAPAAAPSNVTVFPTQPPLPGSVTINHPPDGSIIYAEALYLEGSASDLPAAGFRLEVTSALDELLADVMIQPEANDWSIELVHEYAGDPIEVTDVPGLEDRTFYDADLDASVEAEDAATSMETAAIVVGSIGGAAVISGVVLLVLAANAETSPAQSAPTGQLTRDNIMFVRLFV